MHGDCEHCGQNQSLRTATDTDGSDVRICPSCFDELVETHNHLNSPLEDDPFEDNYSESVFGYGYEDESDDREEY